MPDLPGDNSPGGKTLWDAGRWAIRRHTALCRFPTWQVAGWRRNSRITCGVRREMRFRKDPGTGVKRFCASTPLDTFGG